MVLCKFLEHQAFFFFFFCQEVEFKPTKRATQDMREGGSRERMKLNIVSEKRSRELGECFRVVQTQPPVCHQHKQP